MLWPQATNQMRIPHGFVNGGTVVPCVDVEDVDVVQFHALQRFIKPLHHGLAVITAQVGILGRGGRLAAVAWPGGQNWTHRGTTAT